MFEVARLPAGAIEKHPPEIVYVMLFGLGLGGSLLGGFGMARAKTPSWIHMVTFASALTIVLYVIRTWSFHEWALFTWTILTTILPTFTSKCGDRHS